MTILGTKDWTPGEVLTASNMDRYVGPPQPFVDIDMFMGPIAATGFTVLATSTNDLRNGYRANTPAQNDSIEWNVALGAGTWTLQLMSRKDASSAILTVALSTDASSYTSVGSSPYNASASTIDLYNGSTLYNQQSSLTGITIATTGVYRLRLRAETKNASSSNYAAYLNGLRLWRTA